LTLSEEHAKKLRSVDLREADEQVEAAKKEKEKVEDQIAHGPTEKMIKDKGTALEKEKGEIDKYRSMGPLERSATGVTVKQMNQRVADYNSNIIKLKRTTTYREKLLQDLDKANKNFSNAKDIRGQVSSLIEGAEGTASGLRSQIAAFTGPGAVESGLQTDINRDKARIEILRGGGDLENFERAFAAPRPAGRRGRPSYPDNLQRVDAAKATEAFLYSQLQQGGSEERVEAVGRELEKSRALLARLLKIMEEDSAKTRKITEKTMANP